MTNPPHTSHTGGLRKVPDWWAKIVGHPLKCFGFGTIRGSNG